MPRRHHHRVHVPSAQCVHRQRQRQGRIDAAGQAEHHVAEAVFTHVIAQAGDDDLVQFGGGRCCACKSGFSRD